MEIRGGAGWGAGLRLPPLRETMALCLLSLTQRNWCQWGQTSRVVSEQTLESNSWLQASAASHTGLWANGGSLLVPHFPHLCD